LDRFPVDRMPPGLGGQKPQLSVKFPGRWRGRQEVGHDAEAKAGPAL
jgi:hypothetical protein